MTTVESGTRSVCLLDAGDIGRLLEADIIPWRLVDGDVEYSVAHSEVSGEWLVAGKWYPAVEMMVDLPWVTRYTPYEKGMRYDGLAVRIEGVFRRLSWFEAHAYDNLIFGKFMDGNKATPCIWTMNGNNMFPGGYQLFAVTSGPEELP